MNAYETKRALRIERMRAQAEGLGDAAESARATAQSTMEMIPTGQPILVGHHSERRHRRDIERLSANVDKAIRLRAEAESMNRRADRAESSTAISSDDPDAIQKLRAKLAAIESERAQMLAVN